jgi:hypothetical protein
MPQHHAGKLTAEICNYRVKALASLKRACLHCRNVRIVRTHDQETPAADVPRQRNDFHRASRDLGNVSAKDLPNFFVCPQRLADHFVSFLRFQLLPAVK